MPRKDDVMGAFGPKGMDVLYSIMLDQINILRVKLSLPPVTEDEVFTDAIDRIKSVQDYDFMRPE